MKKLIALAALLAATASAQDAPRVLLVVTSVDKFADGSPTGVWLEEFATPYMTLARAGVQLTVVSPKGGQAPIDPPSAAKRDQETTWKPAMEALHSTKSLISVNASDYDEIFIYQAVMGHSTTWARIPRLPFSSRISRVPESQWRQFATAPQLCLA
jgi:hypothetical protein